MRKHILSGNHLFILFALVAVFIAASSNAFGQAQITIINTNAPGVGFNDNTPAAPVGGNAGTTLGQQRLIAFQHAASIWGSKIASNVEIRIDAAFVSQTCTATAAVLGSAGTTFIFADFPSVAPFPGPLAPNAWHHSALADKRAGGELNPTPGAPDIQARFNANLNGNPACLGGRKFYLGLDTNHGTDIDLVTVLLHEFAHGLGFSQFASVTSGAQPLGLTDVYGRQLLDTTTGKTWDQMTNAERVASAINYGRVIWTGPTVTAAVPNVLSFGNPSFVVNSPAAIANSYAVGGAQFGPPISSPGVTGNVVQALDPADGAGPLTTDGCSPLTNAAAIAGKIALIDRGTCGFTIKVKNAQNAGATAVLIANNAVGNPPPGMAGVDATIIIPSVMISLGDANAIKAQLGGGVNGTLGVDLSVRAGTDASGRARLYAPTPVAPGSSISHFDTIASRNQLMEPNINADLTHSVEPPEDMTLAELRDVGWFADADLDGIADGLDCEANSDRRPTVIVDGCNSGVPNMLFITGPNAGCTIADLINHIAANASNHGQFVSGVAQLTNDLKSQGIITGAQKGAIQSCAAKSSLP